MTPEALSAIREMIPKLEDGPAPRIMTALLDEVARLQAVALTFEDEADAAGAEVRRLRENHQKMHLACLSDIAAARRLERECCANFVSLASLKSPSPLDGIGGTRLDDMNETARTAIHAACQMLSISLRALPDA